MNATLPTARTDARRALLLVLGCAIVAWLLFVAASYIDVLAQGTASRFAEEPTPSAPEIARYVYFASVAVFGLGSLIALRRTTQLRAADATTTLARPVQLLAGTTLIIAAAISTITCIFLFFDGFLGGPADTSPLTQVVNLYVPIVLHTALVVTLVLAGFVFTPSPAPVLHSAPTPHAAKHPAAENPAAQHLAPDESPGGSDPESQRSTALAFAVPVVTAAAAFIAGLIAADLMGTATQVWLWTVVLAVVGAGIVAGTRLAQRALAQQSTGQPSRAATIGAKNLNFVLSIVLAGSAAVMSLGYGASAVDSLSSTPWLSASVSSTAQDGSDGQSWSVNGSDLGADSTFSATLQPGDVELGSASADRDGWIDMMGDLPSQHAAGEYQVEVHGVARDGRAVSVSVPFTITDDGSIANEANADSSADLTTQVSAVSAGWVFSDLLPAGLLLVIASAVVFLTVTTRARAERPSARRIE